jgi:vesicle-associated membrane protein 72
MCAKDFCVGCAVFLVVADESVGRGVSFVFLERVKDDFNQRYGASIKNEAHPLADDDGDDDLFEDRFSIAYNLDREFGCVWYCLCQILRFLLLHVSLTFDILFSCNRPRLKEHMQYCVNHPEEISKLSKLKAQITEVKGIMMDNIDKVHVSCFVESNVGDKPIHV